MIMTCSEFSSLILQNRDSIAFLVGNGLHNYEAHEKRVEGKFNWKELIAYVQDKLSPLNNYSSINEDLTYPEQFDTIVRENTKVKIENNIHESAKNIIPLIENCPKDILAEKEYLKYVGCTKTKESAPASSLYLNNESLLQAQQEIIRRVQSILSKFGISYNSSAYDSQVIAQHLAINGATDDFVAKQIIKGIFTDYKLHEWIVPFLKVASSLRAPILTTNYDTSLSKLLNMQQRKTSGTEQSQFGFPFETYYATTPINQPWDSFAIWHIHGLYKYVNSIRIGKSDYDNLKREIQKRLNETSFPPSDDNWRGNKSWLSILFRKNLLIFGLKLEREEYVLRWLLEERAKYGLKGWYAYYNEDDISDEKERFLHRNGFEIIKVDNMVLHETVWKKIMDVV